MDLEVIMSQAVCLHQCKVHQNAASLICLQSGTCFHAWQSPSLSSIKIKTTKEVNFKAKKSNQMPLEAVLSWFIPGSTNCLDLDLIWAYSLLQRKCIDDTLSRCSL